MQRCIEIAKNGLGYTRPNPMVGCVITHNKLIIGEGFTSPYGGHHAEINAIESVKDKSLLKDASMYVTLEPCAHFGKTPPCSHAIVQHGIRSIYIGTTDTNSLVAGKGIHYLKTNGCLVTTGILERDCKEHHKRFLTFHTKKRPYIILKWAESNDGFISPSTKHETKPIWISNLTSRQIVHKWRAEEQAILVGANTVIKDNPELTTRHWVGNNPIRIVLDSRDTLKDDFAVFNSASKTIKLNSSEIDFTNKPARQISEVLFNTNIQSVIIEGGYKTLNYFINENLWDEARVFKSQMKLDSGTPAPKITGQIIAQKLIGSDILSIYKND